MTIWTKTKPHYEGKGKVDVKISEYIRLCANCTNPVIYTADFKPYCGHCQKVVNALRVNIGEIEKFRTEYLEQQRLAAQYVTDQLIYKANNTFPIDADLQALSNPVDMMQAIELDEMEQDWKSQVDELRGWL